MMYNCNLCQNWKLYSKIYIYTDKACFSHLCYCFTLKNNIHVYPFYDNRKNRKLPHISLKFTTIAVLTKIYQTNPYLTRYCSA